MQLWIRLGQFLRDQALESLFIHISAVVIGLISAFGYLPEGVGNDADFSGAVGFERALLFLLIFGIRIEVHLHVYKEWKIGKELTLWSMGKVGNMNRISELLWIFLVWLNMIEFTQLMQIGIVGRYKFPLGFAFAIFALECFIWVFVPADPVEFHCSLKPKFSMRISTTSQVGDGKSDSHEKYRWKMNRALFLIVCYITGYLCSILIMFYPFVLLMIFSPVLLFVVYQLYGDLVNPSMYIQNSWLRKKLPDGEIVDRYVAVRSFASNPPVQEKAVMQELEIAQVQIEQKDNSNE
jgi:hypothetical protein